MRRGERATGGDLVGASARPGLGSALLRGVLCLPMLLAALLIPDVYDQVGGSERQHSDTDVVARVELAALTVVVAATLVLLPLGWWARRRWMSRALVWPQRVAAVLQLLLGAFAVLVAGIFAIAGPAAYGPMIVVAPFLVSIPFVTAWVLLRDSRRVGAEAALNVV